MGEPTWQNSEHIRRRAREKMIREGAPCHICGEPIDYKLKTPDPGSFEIDHLFSRKTHPELAFTPSNWAPAHRSCNRAKSDKPYAPIIRRSGALKGGA